MTKQERKQRIFYYVDEFVVLLFSIIGVVFSEVIGKRASGDIVNIGDVSLGWFNMLISSLIAIIVYSSMNIQFVYNDIVKPPLVKRISNALLQGIAWQTIVGSVK